MAVVEQVHSMPHDGVSRAFSFGTNYGMIIGALEVMGKRMTVDEVLASRAFADYLTHSPVDPLEDYTRVALSVPKFDVTADSDVIPALKEMGVKKVFDHGGADFSPLTEDRDDIAVDKVQHSARVKIDEEGCEAAAFTAVMAEATGAFVDEPIDFTLDRPFIFVINGAGGAPLFVGVVNGI